MMIAAIVIFIVGYLVIAFEHSLKLDKAAAALITGVLCWTIYILGLSNKEIAIEQLYHHLSEIASILFFLMGAMTIVELIDSHSGFTLITSKIKTRSKLKLLWIIAFVTFFVSALLDNLTTAIVMTSLLTRILDEKEDRLWFAGVIIIAANAGGAFSPLGDVTTTMLWIGGQITAQNIMLQLFLPSIMVCLIPLLIVSPRFRNKKIGGKAEDELQVERKEAIIILVAGITLLLSVPIFKVLTHLPPFMGMLLALGILWIIVSLMHFSKPYSEKHNLTVTHALEKIDSPSILFFLGILLAVSALQSFGLLKTLANNLDHALGNFYLVGTTLGLVSAVIDNVPVVAAAQGMYELNTYPTDHHFWEFLALTAGTGGSAIVIGSAAGVAAMGIEKIEFMWYLKRITWIALVGFFAGIATYIAQINLFM
jgi:Na+/H+ antiporter NhaD/arsenite permease-like protein